MSISERVPPASKVVQVFRRADGGFAYKPDQAPLRADEMLIGRGLSLTEAVELIDEFTAAALGRPRTVGAYRPRS